MKKKIDHDHDIYITTEEFNNNNNKLMTENFAERLKHANVSMSLPQQQNGFKQSRKLFKFVVP